MPDKKVGSSMVQFMKSLTYSITFLVFSVLSSFLLWAQDSPPDPGVLISRYKSSLAPDTFKAHIQLDIQRPDRPARSYKMTIWQKSPEQVKIVFESPASEKGKALIKNKGKIYLLLPDLEEVVHLPPSQVGGWSFIFAENLFPFYFAREFSWGTVRQEEDKVVVPVLRKPGRSLWMDCFFKGPDGPLLKIESFDESGKKLRTTVLHWESEAGNSRLRTLDIENLHPEPYKARIRIEEMDTRPKFKEKMFEIDGVR
jgi:hypothetical protein